MTHPRPLALFSLLALAAGCAANDDGPSEETWSNDRCDTGNVTCQAFGRKNYEGKGEAYELGGEGRAPKLTVVYQSTPQFDPVDFEFNPRSPKELWISNYGNSQMTIVRNFGGGDQQVIERRDPAYSHFMFHPPAVAMGGTSGQWGQLWATCGDNDNGGNYFMGPTLYSADLNVFGGNNPQTDLGSHLDMLHSTSFCRGIAWAGSGNQYFAFNSFNGSIDYYDFAKDHGPGWDDHSDGKIRRFWNKQVRGVDGVMSHVSWNDDDKKLYVADTGNKRILVLDPSQGQRTAPMQGNEDIVERNYYEAPIKVLTAGGPLEEPSGIEASGGLAFVTDSKTSQIHAFNLSDGSLVRTLNTGLPPRSLAGLNFGPDGKLYFMDRKAARLYRIDP